ncbi:MAG: M3 family metallopeptidase [Flavobacteriaceae bacterium]
MKNPLLQKFETPHEAIPFNEIKNEHFIPALKESIQIALSEIDTLVQQTEAPTFENTLKRLDDCGELVSRVSSILFNLNSAETSAELQQITQEAAPLLTQFQNDIRLNETLFERIKTVYETANREVLTPEENTLLEKEYKGFVRNGALLTAEEKENLRKIDTSLAQLSLQFGQNVLADTQAFSLHLTNSEDLKGLPENVIEMAAALALQKNLEGWLFTLDYPIYVPFNTYAENRALRKKMVLAFGSRGFQENPQNNLENIKQIISLRKKRAALLGYSSHAAFVLEERMAKSEQEALRFLEELYEKALPAAQQEWKELEAFATHLGLSSLEQWDTAFVSEKLVLFKESRSVSP